MRWRAIHGPVATRPSGHERARNAIGSDDGSRRFGRHGRLSALFQTEGVRILLGVAEDEVVLRLNRDEALVLFEWLYRTDEVTNDFADLVEDQAEQRALWNLTCLLERELVEPFSAQYVQMVKQARARLRDER